MGEPIQMIAIDGPASSGKSTIAQEVAKELGYLFFDTGVMYRAATLAALREEVPTHLEREISEIAQRVDIDVRSPSVEDGRSCDVLLEGEDVTWEIHSPEVDANVSQVSMFKAVREAMTHRQREIGLRGRVVMVGRDIGTVVLPEADLKIFLDASVEERALRRYKERIGRGEAASYDDILDAMRRRDRLDSTRELAPLCAAPDAVILDTTELSIEQVVMQILELVKQRS
jgi:cytidylate kinase